MKAFFTHPWTVQLVGLLALALLVWFAGPLLVPALESEWARAGVVAALFLLWLAYRLLARALSRRKEGELMAGVAAAGGADGQRSSAEDLDELRRKFDEALRVLQESRARQKSGGQRLHELPWYVIIGAPGSGKTTALENSRLHFPLRERLGKIAVEGVGGTRNCEWLFADEAVLIDTAGRFMTQDSHQAADAAAWQGFLQLLKKSRPGRPLNGALVAVSLLDLMTQSEAQRAQQAAAVRARLQELHDALGVRLPVYVLFTKTDLVAGFTEFFADLGEEERAQVWGETFPLDDPARPGGWLEAFDAGYGGLLGRLDRRGLERVQQTRGIQRRGLVLDFPRQMALLKPVLLAFLQAAFAPNRYDNPPLLRGVYFTSGTQEGRPIDRAMGAIARAFRLDRPITPLYGKEGKSFFVTRLLKEVVFGEAELAGADPRLVRRRRILQAAALASALLAVLGGVGVWTLSYRLNRDALAKTAEEIDRYRKVDAAPADARANFKMLGQKLDALLAVREIWARTGWSAHWGLFQGRKLDEGAEEAYGQVLADYFLPALASRLQERMQGPEGGQPDVLYQLLRVYLMLGQPDRLEPAVAAAVVRADWEQAFAADPETLARLAVHLQNLFDSKPRPAPLDEALVASARARLTQAPRDRQCYDRFKAEALLDRAHDFKLAEALRPNGQRAFTLAEGSSTVPGLYTAWGYTELFLKRGLKSVEECLRQNWVLGVESSAADPFEVERLHDGFKRIYLSDYQQRWSGLLAGVRLQPAQDINQTVERLDTLSRPDSPLRLLLEALEKNTSLDKISADAANALAQLAGKAGLAVDEQTRKLFETGRQMAGGAGGGAAVDPARTLQNYFEGYNALVRGEAGKAPLDASLAKAKELRDYFLVQAGGKAPAGAPDVAAQARLEFARLPEPVKGWLLSLTNVGQRQTQSSAGAALKAALNDKLKAAGLGGGAGGGGGGAGGAGGAGGGGKGGGAGGGGAGGGGASPCKQAFGGRYPFARGSRQDAPPVDFVKFFAPDGVFDKFFKENLKDLDGAQAAGLSAAALRAFQQAARIREAFFGNGPALRVEFDLKPQALDEKADSFRLAVEGQEIAYRRGQEQTERLQWPGPKPGSGVRIVFEAPDKRQAARAAEGPWALFRLLDESSMERSGDGYLVTFQAEGFAARYELRPLSVNNPFRLAELQGFRCPESL